MKGHRFNPGQAYVEFSHVKTLKGLYILNFNTSAIKKSNDVHNEMVRLSNNMVQPVPKLQCYVNHIIISLLNVRSITAKLADISCDNDLKCASIMCFCETWLTASQPSPLIQNGQIAIRCERTSGDSKGGVMISVSETIQPSQIHTIARNRNEAVSTTLILENNTQLCITYHYYIDHLVCHYSH